MFVPRPYHSSADATCSFLRLCPCHFSQARHVEDDTIYALKIIQPEEDDDVSEFIELHILQRCHHPNIVGLLGTWKKGDEIFVRASFGIGIPIIHS